MIEDPIATNYPALAISRDADESLQAKSVTLAKYAFDRAGGAVGFLEIERAAIQLHCSTLTEGAEKLISNFTGRVVKSIETVLQALRTP